MLEASSFLVAARESTARQQETWLLGELQVESSFLRKEKQLDRHVALRGFVQLVKWCGGFTAPWQRAAVSGPVLKNSSASVLSLWFVICLQLRTENAADTGGNVVK